MRFARRLGLAALLWGALAAAQDARYAPKGRQVVALYIASNSCVPCNGQDVKQAIRQMKPLLAEQARGAGAMFTFVLVSADEALTDEPEYAKDLGFIDEHWFLAKGEKFPFAPLTGTAGKPGMPQVIIAERPAGVTSKEPPALRELQRIAGPRALQEWVRRGAKVELGQGR